MSDTPRTDELQDDIMAKRYGQPLRAALDLCLMLERELHTLKNPPCPHTETTGWITFGSDGCQGESWCKHCGKKF